MDRGRAVAGRADAKVADAADREAGAGEIGLGEGDVGQRQLKIRRRLDLLGLERLGRKGADRDRYVLQAFRLTLRRDDDLAAQSIASHFLSRVLRIRSEEHTSELQSLLRISYAVLCLK